MSFTNLHLHFIIWWPILGGKSPMPIPSSIVDGLLAQFHCIRAAATETHAWIEMAQIWISCDIIMRFIIDIHWYIMQSHPSYPFWIILNHFESYWAFLKLPTNLTHHDHSSSMTDALTDAPPAPRLRFAAGSAESSAPAPATVSTPWRERFFRLSSVERPWVEMDGNLDGNLDGIWMGYGSKMDSMMGVDGSKKLSWRIGWSLWRIWDKNAYDGIKYVWIDMDGMWDVGWYGIMGYGSEPMKLGWYWYGI